MSAARLDAPALKRWAHTAVGQLITHTDEINRLNVFPVADADTGTNMLFTMRAAVAATEGRDDLDLIGLTAALADGALRGARGNSGVILSQILRGLADVTADKRLCDIDGSAFGAALLNTRSTTWRGLSEDERATPPLALLAAHPALMKRPLIVDGDQMYLGWDKATQGALGVSA